MKNRIQEAQPDRLSQLISLAATPDEECVEFSGICQEQLDLSIVPDIHDSDTPERIALQNIAVSVTPKIQTFKDLLDHAQAPLELLIWAKDTTKALNQSLVSYVPAEVVSILYYSYIATALILYDSTISNLSVADLQRGFDWCLKKTWPSDEIKRRLRDGQSIIILKVERAGNYR